MMKHIALTPFGRQPMTPALIAARHRAAQHENSPPVDAVDKWAVFDDLRTAKSHYGLKDRDLAVLHALLSFLPAKIMKIGDNLTVFPSNHSLSERVHGMAESTLRRHIAALVQAGVIWRKDSSNGKRYATRLATGGFAMAFGFDLSPLVLRSLEFGDQANALRQAEAELHLARQSIVLNIRDCGKLISYLRDQAQDSWLTFEEALLPLRQALRRKLTADLAAQLLQNSHQILCEIMGIINKIAEETSGSAAQNDRHYSNSNKESNELNLVQTEVDPPSDTPNIPVISLETVLEACPDVKLYGSPDLRTWRDFLITAQNLHGMMGITASVWQEAQRIMGPVESAITLATILQRLPLIQNPNGYLRRLSQKASENAYSSTAILLSLLKGKKLTAVNFG